MKRKLAVPISPNFNPVELLDLEEKSKVATLDFINFLWTIGQNAIGRQYFFFFGILTLLIIPKKTKRDMFRKFIILNNNSQQIETPFIVFMLIVFEAKRNEEKKLCEIFLFKL